MRIVRTRDYQDMSRKAANVISAQVILKPDSVLGLATGSTVEGAYAQLVDWHRKGDVSFAEVEAFNLDEYVGLGDSDEQSFARFMHDRLFDHVDIDPARCHIPSGTGEDLVAGCVAYDELIRSFGYPDLQVVGIGRNGHIGFNEPGDAFSKGTHVVDLTPSTIQANSRFFGSPERVPRQAVTVGVQTIMLARTILMMASGEAKAQAVADMCYGPITPRCPASILQLHHDCIVMADEAALSKCPADLVR
jgi:glucosamine-6-phosphate deaminase